jgi:branched-chain amino acid aminotransferase
MLRNGVFATPPITDNVLEGITRRTVIQLIRDELRMPVEERPIDRTELYLADEMFFCGTGAQISAITRIDHRNVGAGRMGAATEDLRRLYFDVVRGRAAKYRNWCHPIYEVKKPSPSRETTHVTVE